MVARAEPTAARPSGVGWPLGVRTVPAALLVCGACAAGTPSTSDTDLFAPDQPGLARNTHIVTDLVGTWNVRIPKPLERKFAVIDAALNQRSASSIVPPLMDDERPWFDGATDPEQPYREWHYCAENCRFEIGESLFWNHGYSSHVAVGSALTVPTLNGRDVEFRLWAHDPSGMAGTVRIRMSKDWKAFRVETFEVEHFAGRHLGQKLEFFYVRAAEEAP